MYYKNKIRNPTQFNITNFGNFIYHLKTNYT